MKLDILISLISIDEVIHIVTQDKSVWFGKVENIYDELDDKVLKKSKVNGIFSGFGGLCIEVA